MYGGKYILSFEVRVNIFIQEKNNYQSSAFEKF